ncbi:MAG: M48 family metallopeptidase [Fibrobacterota bacterium]
MTYLSLAILLLAGEWLLSALADLLNLTALRKAPPVECRSIYDDSEYRRSQQYLRARTKLSLTVSGISRGLLIACIAAGGFGFVHSRLASFSLMHQTVLFSAGMILLMQVLSLPASLVSTFVVEERFGFNRTTMKTFLTDRVRELFISLLLVVPLYTGLVLILQGLGEWAWLAAWAGLTLVQILLMWLAPAVILPLFNRFTPLPEGPLRERLTAYAEKVGLAIRGIWIMDGSRRSSKANAFFTGFGRTRRIALFDTLVDRHSPEEVEAILAHETGHFKKGHIRQMLLMQTALSGILFFLMGQLMTQPALYRDFGAEPSALYLLPVLFSFFIIPLSLIFGMGQQALSRKNEFEADAFACETSSAEALIRALKRLSAHSLTNLTPHPLKVLLEYSHPPLAARIRALRRS